MIYLAVVGHQFLEKSTFFIFRSTCVMFVIPRKGLSYKSLATVKWEKNAEIALSQNNNETDFDNKKAI